MHSPDVLTRFIIGAFLAGLIVAPAIRAGALTRSGGLAALVAGSVTTAAGWPWAILLVAYFIVTTALTRVEHRAKSRRTGDVVAKGGARDWRQVAANGGVFTIAAAWIAVAGDPGGAGVTAFGIGALAAAAADSWGTEVGTLAKSPPRSILTLRPVPTGTSGGISMPGTIALAAGAAFIALLALVLGFPATVARAALAGGIFGAIVDSLLGATLQARRWCPACERETEQPVHRCGTETTSRGGVRWLDNDAVNLACTLAGGLLAAVIAG